MLSVDRLVLDLARATGRTEAQVRVAYEAFECDECGTVFMSLAAMQRCCPDRE